MAITLRIDNFDQLPDGGPIEYTAGARGFDIGRGQHLDWCLPDDSRFISTTHCEVRFENGSYWLRDVSKNGTFVNGAEGRVNSPYRLANGDRLKIGPYFVSVGITGGAEASPRPAAPGRQDYAPAPDGDLWSVGTPAPQPMDRRLFANEQRRGQRAPDVMDHFIDMPAARNAPAPQYGTQYPNGAPQAYPPAGAPQWAPQPAAYPPQNTQYPQGQMPGGPSPFAPAAAPGYAPPPFAPAQMPMPQQAPVPGYPGGAGHEMPASAFIAAVAAAAGISPQALSGRPPEDVAAELGAILRTASEQLSALLRARAKAKQVARSSTRTMIAAQDNNPLKFVPDVREAMEIMFARNRAGYLSAAQGFKEGFEDVKRHEMATFAAMQKALARLAEDLTPEEIEDKAGGSAFGSKKARAWDLYVERWNEKTKTEHGILDVFMAYFGEAYDAANKG